MSNTVDATLGPLTNLALDNVGANLLLDLWSYTRVGIFPFGVIAKPDQFI